MTLDELMKTPDFFEVMEGHMRDLAREQPDFVYNPRRNGPATSAIHCRYDRGVYDGPECSGCLFGRAFQRCGVELANLGTLEGISGLLANVGIISSTWVDVQILQDNGMSWGEAIKLLDGEGGGDE